MPGGQQRSCCSPGVWPFLCWCACQASRVISAVVADTVLIMLVMREPHSQISLTALSLVKCTMAE